MGGKPVLILFVFILLLTMFARSALRNKDLTPRTPFVQTAPQNTAPLGTTPLITSGQNPVYTSASGGTTVTGGWCASPYVVQCGDTLSSISRACGVSLQAIIAANPGIANPHLIHPNDMVVIPGVVVAAPTATTAPTVLPTAAPTQGDGIPTMAPTQPQSAPTIAPTTASELNGFQAAAATATPGDPLATQTVKLRPGSEVELVVPNLPPNSTVEYALGRVATAPGPKNTAVIGSDGVLRVKIKLPMVLLSDQQWTITVTSPTDPALMVTAVPVTVGW